MPLNHAVCPDNRARPDRDSAAQDAIRPDQHAVLEPHVTINNGRRVNLRPGTTCGLLLLHLLHRWLKTGRFAWPESWIELIECLGFEADIRLTGCLLFLVLPDPRLPALP
jgi:hypothetical protein